MLRLRSALVFAVALAACARVQSHPDIVQQGAPVMHGRVTDHVVVISIDGLRADAIEHYNAPTLERLMREGRYSLTAQTIPLSLTLPSHTSMLTGVGADVHHVTWNSDKTKTFGYVKVPTVFGVAHDAGFRTAAFFSKTKFHHLEIPGTLDFAQAPEKGILPWDEQRTTDNVRAYLGHASPNLMFVHIAEPDFVGHNFGWMGMVYGAAVREADRGVAHVIDAANDRFGEGNWTLIVTADHGGHGRTHGTTDPRDMTIPWIVWGEGVTQGDTLSGIHTMDTAATALWLLGVSEPASWVGRPVTSAFASSTVASK